MIIVPIKKDSIKKNPRAGETTTIVRQDKYYYFVISGDLPDYFIEGKNVIIEDCIEFFGARKFIEYKGQIIKDDILKQCRKDNINIEIKVDTKAYSHAPLANYLFEYENPDIKCNSCKETIKINDLESESYYDGEDDYYSSTICPKCKTWNCCELEYEKLNN